MADNPPRQFRNKRKANQSAVAQGVDKLTLGVLTEREPVDATNAFVVGDDFRRIRKFTACSDPAAGRLD